jgi:hypothetical protein
MKVNVIRLSISRASGVIASGNPHHPSHAGAINASASNQITTATRYAMRMVD